jgi:hypothetical protein
MSDVRQLAMVAAAEEIAYMDVATASPAMKADVLEARKVIIYNETWIADGYHATVTAPDGTKTEVPHFSDLFPGWDLPVEETRNTGLLRSGTGQGTRRTYLQNPTSVNTNPFLVAYDFRESLYVQVQKLETSATCNIGFTNEETGESVGVFTRKAVGYSVGIDAVPGTEATISVRASTYSNPGYGTFYYSYW